MAAREYGPVQHMTAEAFVKGLDSLGYFKFADPELVEELKQSHLDVFDPEGAWGGTWDEETFVPYDYRYFLCDGEAVFEAGGFTEMLDMMQPAFEKIGLQLTVDHHEETWDAENEWLNHRITLNGTEYIIFKNFRGYGWGEAVQRLAEILNAELAKQALPERVYLVHGGNDGQLILLDEPLYQYFSKVFTVAEWRPLPVAEWVKVMGVAPMDLK